MDNPYRFGGKERLDASGLDLYDFGARYYNPALPRWLTMDPLAERYYGVSPYVFCAGNPVNNYEIDGRDFRKKRHFKTITISANFYTKNRASYDSARLGASFWNNRKNDTYTDNVTGITYRIQYNIIVTEPTPMQDLVEHENTYEINDTQVDRLTGKQAVGVTKNHKNVYVKKNYSQKRPDGKISSTGAHEIGHTLGMEHVEYGIMSETQDESRTPDVTAENIKQMMSSSVGSDMTVDFITRVYETFKKFF